LRDHNRGGESRLEVDLTYTRSISLCYRQLLNNDVEKLAHEIASALHEGILKELTSDLTQAKRELSAWFK